MKYPDQLVARIKAACKAGIPQKLVARWANVPPLTVRDYAAGTKRSDVVPDPVMGESLEALIRGET